MLAMENSLRHARASQPQFSFKQRRSGYEPSDTESEWQESPWHDLKNDGGGKDGALFPERPICVPHPARSISPLGQRRNSKSPYKPRRDDGNILSPKLGSDSGRNISPLSKSDRRRHISPYKIGREEPNMVDDDYLSSKRRHNNHRLPRKHLGPEENAAHPHFIEGTRGGGGEKSNYSRRSLSAPKSRPREKDSQVDFGHIDRRGDRTPSPLSRNLIRNRREASYVNAPSAGEINEMVANAKVPKGPNSNSVNVESTESISQGDIFFSHGFTALSLQKNILPNNGGFASSYTTKPDVVFERDSYTIKPKVVFERDAAHHRNRENGNLYQKIQGVSSSTIRSRTTTTSSSAVSRQSSGKISTESSRISDASGRTSESVKKFTANRQKSQAETWFSCVKRAPCRTSKSPEPRAFDEASFIEKAFVVEQLRQFWADKHQPSSLNGFSCHEQQAQILKQLISNQSCPHVLFKGPSGSGKKALTMAFLREIYGDPAWNISHDLRYFHIQENRPMQIVVPVTFSPHHVELCLNSESMARFALMALVKEITSSYEITPEVSNAGFKADYKVIVLYNVDKVAENVQHLIKWIMDCYTDACKLVLCCEDDVDIHESVKSHCKVIMVEAPVTHEIMEVLIHIARKENFDLSMSFAAKIATKSKQNLRQAIMALEACKAHKYPFVDEQPIPLGWEEVLVELAAEILADPSPKRLFLVRGKFQKLLVDFVHPKLILQKLVEQFLKGVTASLKRELYYWHAYYDKRLPVGTNALLKLEEFVAKFMSIYKKSFSSRYP